MAPRYSVRVTATALLPDDFWGWTQFFEDTAPEERVEMAKEMIIEDVGILDVFDENAEYTFEIIEEEGDGN